VFHDINEAIYGDQPSPTKKRTELSTLPQHSILVKVADKLEAIMFLREEEMLGNSMLERIRDHNTSELMEVWEYFDYKKQLGRDIDIQDVIEMADSMAYNPTMGAPVFHFQPEKEDF